VQSIRYEEFDLTKGLNSVQEGSYSQEKNSFASEKTFTLKEDVLSSQSSVLDKGFETAFQEKKRDNTLSPEREHLCNEVKETKEGQESLFTAPFLSEEARISHRIIGEVFQTYWLIEYGNSLYIMDQHAAHEKINFERMMRRKKEKEVFSQNIIPLSIHLSTGEREVLEGYKKEFLEMGYLWEEEPNGISLTAIPVDFPTVRQEEVLLEILDGLMEDSAILEGESIYNKIASMSCKAAVKGNQKISVAECDTILQELLQLDNPFACPHGRPTIVAFKKQDLEKMFKRIV
jgi:possible DNA mismatch repair protein mutL